MAESSFNAEKFMELNIQSQAKEQGVNTKTTFKNKRWAKDWLEDMEKQETLTKPIPTKITKLDNKINGGLFPGIYLIGGVPGCGKSSIALQIADNLAEQGKKVMYFSLEMSPKDLVAKSLSRYSLNIYDEEMDGRDKDPTGGRPHTAQEILSVRDTFRADDTMLLQKAIERYRANCGDNVMIIGGNTSADKIKADVEEFIRDNKTKPIVIVDYLQQIKSSVGTTDPYAKINEAIAVLSDLRMEKDITLILISALNRNNYGNGDSEDGGNLMSGYKGSGNIEYCADVGIKMEQGKNTKEGKNALSTNLIIVKGRFSRSRETIPLTFYGDCGYFE